MKKANNFSKIIAPYTKRKLWIALSSDRRKVIGKGTTPLKALEEATKNGEKNPSILKAVPNIFGFIGGI